MLQYERCLKDNKKKDYKIMQEIGISDVIVTQGYVGVRILQNLDNRSLCNSRLVCRDWQKFIDAQLLWWQRIINGCHSRQSLAFCPTKMNIQMILLKICLDF